MKAVLKKNDLPAVPEIVCGSFSKEEAAKLISAGTRHVHSSRLGDDDLYAKITKETLNFGRTLSFPWELQKDCQEITILSSDARNDVTQKILSGLGGIGRKERVTCVTEELLSNAIYHAYQLPDGSPKYLRLQTVTLSPTEAVSLRFACSPRGLFLSVVDQGGALTFKLIAQAFSRCYARQSDQIENKESGAGLGLYMVFEAVTHLKIVTIPGKKSIVSCWIEEQRAADPHFFSFNYFEKG
ncbi:MAG: hypothetical protein HY537_12150 [Deltaproteobacteria bacterium]|nr:hypothetical protein [Deltaproteobacteria bacterium]